MKYFPKICLGARLQEQEKSIDILSQWAHSQPSKL